MRNYSYWSDGKHRGLDFLRFLTTEQIVINGQPKKEIQNIYNTGYAEYREQISPGETQIPFPLIVKALFILGRLHLREDKVFPGQAPPHYINSHQKGTQRQQQSNKQNPSQNLPKAAVVEKSATRVQKDKETTAPKKRSRNRIISQ